MKNEITNMAELAQLAGVSKSTVSRALNGSPLISHQTTEKIRKLAKKHGFYGDYRASCLSRGTSRVIGCTVCNAMSGNDQVANTFHFELISRLSAKLNAFNYDLMILNIDELPVDWPDQYFNSKKVDGFILQALLGIEEQMDRLLKLEAPFITFGDDRPLSPYPTVVYDNLLGSEMVVEHLISRGRKKIGYLRGPRYSREADSRERGYRNALKEAGLAMPFEPVAARFLYQDGLEATELILESHPDIDALAVSCDAAAFGAIRAIHKKGLKVPGDIAVTGFDNISLSAHFHPALTTVGQDMDKAAQSLLENLRGLLEEKTLTNTILTPELIIRDSS